MQHECIPAAILGTDLICQAKSGMGKTAVFVLSTLHLIEKDAKGVVALVITHTRELAYQILEEFNRFTKVSKMAPTVRIWTADAVVIERLPT